MTNKPVVSLNCELLGENETQSMALWLFYFNIHLEFAGVSSIAIRMTQ